MFIKVIQEVDASRTLENLVNVDNIERIVDFPAVGGSNICLVSGGVIKVKENIQEIINKIHG